ncbi:MAG: phosphoribosyltransferase [Candidatus Geothermarchaeales archaeon]
MKLITEEALRNRFHVFQNRAHVAELLTRKLETYRGRKGFILAVPSGGVPIGYTISSELHLPLDLVIVRKIQIPWQPEAGFGSITSGGDVYLNDNLVASLRLSDDVIDRCLKETKEEIERRDHKFRRGRPFPEVQDMTVIVVDDGLASGYTMLAAVESVRRRSPSKVVVAVGTASEGSLGVIEKRVDEAICLNIRGGPFYAVADAYQEWHDLSDGEVLTYLKKVGGSPT